MLSKASKPNLYWAWLSELSWQHLHFSTFLAWSSRGGKRGHHPYLSPEALTYVFMVTFPACHLPRHIVVMFWFIVGCILSFLQVCDQMMCYCALSYSSLAQSLNYYLSALVKDHFHQNWNRCLPILFATISFAPLNSFDLPQLRSFFALGYEIFSRFIFVALFELSKIDRVINPHWWFQFVENYLSSH